MFLVAHDKRTMPDWKTGTPQWIDFDLGIHRKVIRTVSPSWNQKWNPTTDRICRSLPTNLPITTKINHSFFGKNMQIVPWDGLFIFKTKIYRRGCLFFLSTLWSGLGAFLAGTHVVQMKAAFTEIRIPEKWRALTFTQKKGHGCHWCARTLKNVLLKCPPGSLTPRKFQHTPRAHPRQCPWPTMKGIPL